MITEQIGGNLRKAGLLLLVILLAGCTMVYEIPFLETNYPQKDRIDLGIELIMTQSFRNAKWVQRGWDIIPLGDNLCKSAEEVAQALFSSVSVKNDVTELPNSNVDAILIPHILSIFVNPPPFVFQATKTTIVVEWTLKNRMGAVIWKDEFDINLGCHGCTAMWGARSIKKHGGEIIREFSQQSFKKLSSADAIRKFEQSKLQARTPISHDLPPSSEGYKEKDIEAVEGIEAQPEDRPKPKRAKTRLFDD